MAYEISDKVSILLVDDSPAGLVALEAVVADLADDVVRARTGREALDKLFTRPFAVVILDIRLPDLDGFEIARRLRAQEDYQATPIIFVTAFDDQPAMATDAYSLGAVDFLTKPLVPAVLKAKVKVFVDLHRKSVRLQQLERQQLEAHQQAADLALAQLNQNLQRRVAEFETLLAVLPVGIGLASDRDCREITVNPAFAEQLGLRPGANASLSAPDGERPGNFKIFQNGQEITSENLPMQLAAREGREVREEEFDVVHADGRLVRLLEYAAPLFDEQKVPRGSVGVFVDITQRKAQEEALRFSEEKFRLMADSAPVLIWLAGSDQRCTWFNKPWLEFTGRGMEEEITSGWVQRVHPDDVQRCVETYKAAFDAKQPFSMDYRLRRHDGVYRWVVDHGIPLYGARGEYAGYIGSCIDITDRRESEEQSARLLEEVTRKSRQLEVLSRGSKEVNTVLDMDAIMRTLVATALQLVDAQGGSAGVFQNNTMVFCEYNERGRVFPVDFVFRPEDRLGIPSWVMRERTHYVTNDALRDDVIRPDLRARFRIYNAIDLPIISRQGELLGCFELHNKREGRPFTQADLGHLQGLAASAAVALENARLLEKIRQADRRKDEFLAMLAHELRNPLAPVRNALDILRLRGDDNATVFQMRELMDRQIRHMGRLIDDLLDVSRITRGRIELRREQLDLAHLVRQGVDAHRPAMEAAGLSVSINVPQIPVWTHGDSTRLAQILDNLLSNATKFTDSGGHVEVHLLHERFLGEAILSVRDTGIGIAADDLPLVFDVFTQADRSLDRTRGGLGLGLALVKGLVELHGGRVKVDSRGLQCGSTFTVYLPALPEPAAVTNSPPDMQPPRQSLQVLVVEDNRDAANMLCMLLKAFGHETSVAYSGPDGIDKAKRIRPQVVLCDIGLPGMDGFAVARALRQDASFEKTRLIAVTGYGRDEDRVRALQAGFDEHITKPADAEQLLAKLALVGETQAN